MSGQRATNLRVLACFAMATVLTLAVSFAVAAATPSKALAESKSSVWVIDKVVTKYNEGASTDTVGYNAKGLVTSRKSITKGDGYSEKYLETYGYTSKNAFNKFVVQINGKKQATFTFKTNSKGYTTKSVQKSSSGTKYVSTFKYDKKGQLKSANTDLSSYGYKFDSKGRLSQMTVTADGDKSVFGYKYDSKGIITKSLYNKKTQTIYKNTYKNGRLAKQVAKDSEGTAMYTCKFTYKKVKVPKSLVKMVKAQQSNLVNHEYAMYLTHK